MNNEELIVENVKLKERIEFLENIMKKGSRENTRAYNEIRLMIVQKAEKEVETDIVNGQEKNWTRKTAEKQIMSDLKWDLRIRRVADFRDEHIEPAKEYINNYILPEELKKSRWRDVKNEML